MTSYLLGEISHNPTNYMPCPPTLFEDPQNHGASERDHPQCQAQPQEEMKRHLEMEGSSDHQLVSVNSINNCYTNYSTNHSLSCHYVREGGDQHESVKWMQSKMRIMRKIMNSDHHTTRKTRRRHLQPQDQKKQPIQEKSNENFHAGGIIRVCSACKTTKTPLWRSGPCGPKSLCNACGIRQRKARRAMAASTVINGRLLPVAPVGKSAKDKALDVDCSTVPFKKRCRFTSAEIAQRKLCFEDTVFPQDEKDAAILLMALSCGLICN